MASEPRALNVVLSSRAINDLNAVWEWNAAKYGEDHADKYFSFLLEGVATLTHAYQEGRAVGVDPTIRYIVLKMRTRGHGHLAVYQVSDLRVEVLHIFHTAQDWRREVTDLD